MCVYISIYLLFIYLFNGGCKPNYKCGALSCRCLKQVCISVSMPGSEELNISGYWPHAEEKGTLPTLHDVLEGVWPNYIKCRSRGMQYIYIYICSHVAQWMKSLSNKVLLNWLLSQFQIPFKCLKMCIYIYILYVWEEAKLWLHCSLPHQPIKHSISFS